MAAESAEINRSWKTTIRLTSIYMITASTLNHTAVLSGTRTKSLFRSELQKLLLKFNMTRAWVVLDNHYHLLHKTDHGRDLGSFTARLHGSTTRQINLWHEIPGRQYGTTIGTPASVTRQACGSGSTAFTGIRSSMATSNGWRIGRFPATAST
jgi:REP element-mobilizing transposase RayT